MTIRTLRKGYSNLSMLQRLSLADNAIARDDEAEALAIKKASPREHYSRPDFCELFDEITRIRLCNLIVRLGHIMNFDLFHSMELEKLNNKSVSDRHERLSNDLKLAAYLYVRATDSWNVINDEMGLRPNFDDEIGGFLLSKEVLQRKDILMRAMAFSESEAKEYVRKQTGSEVFRTVEDEIDEYRKYLNLK
jgi:hypothetical protein